MYARGVRPTPTSTAVARETRFRGSCRGGPLHAPVGPFPSRENRVLPGRLSKTIVEHLAEPVPIPEPEREAHERFTTSRIRSRDPGWTWTGPPVPEHQPAYETFYPAQDGRLLVSRRGTGERAESPDCIDDPSPEDFLEAQRTSRTLSVCWRDPLIWDVFGSDGSYLGDLELPDLPVVADPFMDNETLLLAIEDNTGTIMVKRYRLVLPGEGGR